ncbi:MAG TPA: hypothetical protein VN841_27545 [Bryobacteraceae bacterium]|nr:hypothetical protein [Bryobacteraceae bacterium]
MQIIDSSAAALTRRRRSRNLVGGDRELQVSSTTDLLFGVISLMVVLSAGLVLSLLFLWRSSPVQTFDFLVAYLPLTLPILTVGLTVILRPHELVDLHGWLRLSTTFSLGLVSFAIWAFVAGQSVSQYIVINSTKVYNKDHAMFLLLVAFIWATSGSLVTALAESAEKKRRWKVIQAIQFAFSLAACFVLPFLLLEDKAAVEKSTGQSFDTRQFIVNIPYRNASLNQHLGRSTDPITECFVARHVSAKSRAQAIRRANELMSQEDLAFSKGRGSSAIEVLESQIVEQEEP